MFFDNIWYCVAQTTELSTQPFERVVCNQPLVLFRTAKSGQPVAMENRCPHRQAPLSMGRVIGDEIMCGYHGWVMAADGSCSHVPHQEATSRNARIQSYPIAERWGFVWAWLGAPESADAALIPEMPWLVSEDRSSILSNFRAEASDQLMADNLLDVSHADFLHAQSFGSRAGQKGETDTVHQEMEPWTKPGSVHSNRVLKNVALGPMAAAWGGFTERVTRTTSQNWRPPNTVNIELVIANAENTITINHDHVMTPETETSCHYFFAFTRDFALEGGYPNDNDMRREQDTTILTEDIPMVEAQQRNRIRFGDPIDIPGQADKFLIAVHKRIADIRGNGQPAPPYGRKRVSMWPHPRRISRRANGPG